MNFIELYTKRNINRKVNLVFKKQIRRYSARLHWQHFSYSNECKIYSQIAIDYFIPKWIRRDYRYFLRFANAYYNEVNFLLNELEKEMVKKRCTCEDK